jgi:hypothetical protein
MGKSDPKSKFSFHHKQRKSTERRYLRGRLHSTKKNKTEIK